MLYALSVLLAQEPTPEGPPGWLTFAPPLLILALFFFLIILPAQRREKRQREEMTSKLKKNDEVVTTAGIIGVVHTIKDGDEVILKSDEGRIRVLKSSIVRILNPKEAPTDGAKP